MDFLNLLDNASLQSLIKNVAQKLNMSESETEKGISAGIPAILAGLTKNAQSPQGAESLDKALASKHDGSLLDNLSGLLQGQPDELEQDGQGILGHVFGSNKPKVEEGLSKKTGISMSKIGPMLAMLAPIVMGFLGKQKRQNNVSASGLTGLLGGLLGGAKSSGGIMGMVTGMLDKDGDGSVIDDVMGMFGKK